MNSNIRKLFDLSGRTAVITGGGGLLGESHAEGLAEFGCNTVLLDINSESGRLVSERIKKKYKTESLFFNCDITNKDQVEEVKNTLLKKYQSIEILINNAALDPKITFARSDISLSRLEYFPLDQWAKELSVGLTGAFLCTQVFGVQMVQQHKGVIINISSDLGIIAPDQRLYKKEDLPSDEQPVKPITYSVIKHGLIGLTKYIATYWADKGVRANSLCPGGVYNNQPEEFVRKISSLIPLGRMAHKDEYKAAIVYLASDASSYMNGATIVIDGGRTIW
jgi:NAD(P)-dependent dehydrogenase (short-subunit alcohol dehydrogenase family)